ncbi:MAG TPA: hypothetical protein VFJ85_14500 [Acidimicrobiales bacterium]|nr:hypothetical protein [Acidimicrobiales bacterium]
MTQLYVTLRILLLEATARARRDERGQSTLEYLGMVGVAVLLVLAVMAVVGDLPFGKFFNDAITKIKAGAGM